MQLTWNIQHNFKCSSVSMSEGGTERVMEGIFVGGGEVILVYKQLSPQLLRNRT
jgi:hypothetical protein